MKKQIINLMLTFFMLSTVVSTNVIAQFVTVLPNNGGTSGNGRAPSVRYSHARAVYLITPAEMAASGFINGSNVSGIGWTYQAAGAAGIAGLKVYLQNTSDVAFSKSGTWATTITGMTLAHDNATTTLTGTITPNVTFSGGAPFVYSGLGVYVAFDWGCYGGSLQGIVALCNTSLASGFLGSQQQVACPGTPSATLTLVSAFRPETRLAQPQPLNDLSVTHIYTQGNVAVGYGTPVTIKARITNPGANAMPASTATLNITGSNLFSDSKPISALSPGASEVITFSVYTPSSLGPNTIDVSIPADDALSNNTLLQAQTTSKDISSYKYPTPPITTGVGFTGATGDFVARFVASNNFGNSDTINGFEVVFTTTGQPYQVGVWTDAAGVPGTNIYTSAAQVSALGSVFISLPDVEVSGVYYVGIRQTGTVNVGFGYQTENPVRVGDFFFTSPTGGVTWTDFNAAAANFRISATVQYKTPIPPNCAVYLAPANASVSCQNGVTLSYGSGGGGPTGYRVYFGTNQALVEAENAGTLVQNSAATTYPTGVLTPATTYYWRVTAYNGEGDASGCATLSNSFSTNLTSCYCLSSSANATFESITNVQLGAFSNPSAGTIYSNFTNLGSIGDVNIGSTFNITITQPLAQVYEEDKIFVFADFNQDGDWSDLGELCGTGDVTIANGNVTVVTCTVPVGALSGNTLLRIKLGDEVSVTAMDNSPCQVGFAFGEVEDYLINLTCGSSITATTPACENGVMNFQANYFGNSTPSTYVWSGPNGFTSGISNPSIPSLTLADGGTYTVTVTDVAACSSTSSVTFAVSPAPVVIVSSNTPVCIGNDINLNSSGGVSYLWSGPNGFNDVAQNPIVSPTTLASAGAYIVTVTDAFGCTASATENVSVNANPVLNIISQSDVGCTGGNDGAFTIGATGSSPFLFDENGNTNFDGIFTSYSAGSYTVVVTDANSCSSSIGVALGTTSIAPPSNGASILPLPSSACVGQIIPVSCNTIIGATSYTWSTPAGTLINGLPSPQTTAGPNVNITLGTLPGNSSSWLICVFGANGCGQTNTNCKYIRGALSMPSIINGSNVACENTSGIYSVNPVGGASSYLWTGTNGITFTGSGNSITANFPNGFTTGIICVAGQLPCGYTGPARCITVNNSIPSLGLMSGTFGVCPGQNGVAFSVPPANGASTYTWTPPAGVTIASGAGTNAVTVNIGPGFISGSMCVTATTACGAVSSPRCNTVSASLPNTPGNISGAATGICGQTITYSVPSVFGVSYTWTAPAGANLTSPNGINTINVTYPGNFTTGQLCVTANNACGASAPRCINVKGSPSNAGPIAGNNAVCANDAGINYSIGPVFGATGYVWTVPSGATIVSGQGTTSINVDWGTNGGTIGVTAQSPCGNSGTRTLAVSMNCKLSANSLPGSSLNVYPNPVSTMLNVELTTILKGNYSLELFDLSGRLVYQNQIAAIEGFNQLKLDVSGFVKGMYLLSVKDASGFTQQVRVAVK